MELAKEGRQNRFLELDYLRGLAALSVVIFHYTYGYDNGLHHLNSNKYYFRYGNLGVQLFFIISGFVIFMTLEKAKNSADFFISRFSRLYPAYWGAILISLTFVSIFKSPFNFDEFTLKQLFLNITMLQHWFKVKDIDGAYWTLAVELTFYFLMWILFYFNKLKHVELFALGWLFLSLLNQIFKLPYNNIIQQIFILTNAPMFVVGIVFYNVKTKQGYNFLRTFLLLFSLLIESIIVYKSTLSVLPILILVFFYLIFILILKKDFVLRKNKILLFFGTISYSLYLIHENIGETIIYYLRKVTDVEFIYVSLPILITVCLSYLLTVFIEKPAMKWIRSRSNSRNKVVKI
jgi:peptidoglycan/LPS O-acetylase OafA/YrhL